MFAHKLVLEPKSNAQTTTHYYPNRFANMYLSATESVLGKYGLETLFNITQLNHWAQQSPNNTLAKEFPFADLAAMNNGLSELYGSRGGQGMATRIGQMIFTQGFSQFGVLRSFNDPMFQSLPRDHQAELGLRALAAIFSHFSDQYSVVESSEKSFKVKINHSPFATTCEENKPKCYPLVGLIQTCLQQATDGYVYNARETQCCACGDERCVIHIDKTPLTRTQKS